MTRGRILGAAQSLSSLLIMPVQRIPRYELLLRDMARHALGNDRGVLASVADAIQDLARDVNARKRRHDNEVFGTIPCITK